MHPEDQGLIRFVAGPAAVSEASLQVEGTSAGCEASLGSSTMAGVHQAQLVGFPPEPAHPTMPKAPLCPPALPIRIVKPLRDKTVLARHKATLECTVSHARGRVRWLRGDTEIFAGDKYEICNLDCYRTLIIHHVGPEDEDSYTCDAFDDCSTARLLVEGEGAPGRTPVGADGTAVPASRGTPGALFPCSTACKGLSAELGGAGWRWGLHPPAVGHPFWVPHQLWACCRSP